jgi:hypothetical protein
MRKGRRRRLGRRGRRGKEGIDEEEKIDQKMNERKGKEENRREGIE